MANFDTDLAKIGEILVTRGASPIWVGGVIRDECGVRDRKTADAERVSGIRPLAVFGRQRLLWPFKGVAIEVTDIFRR